MLSSFVVRSVQNALEYVAVELDDQSHALVRQWWFETYGSESDASPAAMNLAHRVTHLVRNVLQDVANFTLREDAARAMAGRPLDGDALPRLPSRCPPLTASGNGTKRTA